MVIWFTGLPGSGKTTLAVELNRILSEKGFNTYVLDGDALRKGLNADLGFSDYDRSENIRRAAEVARILALEGFIVLATFISPFQKDRKKARVILGSHYVEVFVNCPLEVCELRDPKGMYRKARNGDIREFTGISSPYEIPVAPDIVISTGHSSVKDSLAVLQKEIQQRLAQ